MIAWMDEYCLGVEHIDEQHKNLFTVINRILRIIDEGDNARSRRTCIEALKYLKDYTLNHFADEEAYQLEIGYEKYGQHKAEHEAFIRHALEMEQDMELNSYSRESVRRFIDALTAWLVNHIMRSDQDIAAAGK